MKADIKNYVTEVINLVETKRQLDQIIFDISSLVDRIGYRSVVNGGDEMNKRRILISNELQYIDSVPLKNYFSELLMKDDLWLFEPSVFQIFFEELKTEISKIIIFKLTTAIELTRDDLKKITKKLSKKTERRVMVDVNIDKNIIGGAIIHKDNYILDFSIQSKLDRLASEWKKTIEKADTHA